VLIATPKLFSHLFSVQNKPVEPVQTYYYVFIGYSAAIDYFRGILDPEIKYTTMKFTDSLIASMRAVKPLWDSAYMDFIQKLRVAYAHENDTEGRMAVITAMEQCIFAGYAAMHMVNYKMTTAEQYKTQQSMTTMERATSLHEGDVPRDELLIRYNDKFNEARKAYHEVESMTTDEVIAKCTT
jgi:hypothetical protein